MKKYRKNIRLKHYNYTSNGYYFVTVCTRKFFPFLKFIKGEVEKCISNLPQFISGLTVDYFVVMDNHIHIIFVLDGCKRSLGQIVRALKYTITKKCSGRITIRPKSHGNATATGRKMKIWERNYYEHVIRNEKALQKIRQYIVNNPEIEKLNFEQFYEA